MAFEHGFMICGGSFTSLRKFFSKKSQKLLVSLKKGCTFAAVFGHTEEGKEEGRPDSSLKA
jgi:hypothetical protein